MKALTHYRSAALRVAVAVLFLSASVSAFVSASSLPTAGHTGQALALKAALHPNRTAAQTKRLMDDAPWHHFPNGRFAADPKSFGLVAGQAGAHAKPHAAGNAQPILINEGVQTFDVFAPPPSFAPTSGALTPIDLEPVWTADENYIIFSSNRAGDGHFHLFAIPSQGGLAVQLTTGSGDEYYPALNKNNSVLAFTSSANSTTGNQDLYIIGGQSGVAFTIGQTPIDPANLAGNAGSSLTLGDTGIFTNVTRPTLSPAGDRVVFSATTASNAGGHTANIRHLYYLYVSTHGYDPTQITVPAQLTDGPAADTDPAWSPKGDFIAFASNATGFTNTGTPLSAAGSSTVSAGSNITPNTPRALFLLNAGTTTSVGTVPSTLTGTGGLVSVTGTDNFGPAWSADTQNQYTNPNGDLEYIAFARGAAGNLPHDIYYFLLTTNNTDSTITISPESGANAAIKVNTDDNNGESAIVGNAAVANPGNAYDDIYPSWSPFTSVFSIVYQSPRSITYNTSAAPTTGANLPLEVAVSLSQGATGYGNNNAGAAYTGILESQVLNLDPPTLLRYDGTEVVRVTDANGVEPSGRFIQPGQPVTFTVRLSNREAGTDNTGAANGGPNVYLQIKDPDSKYQDSQNIEHKIFARTNENPGTDPISGAFQGTNGFDYRNDSGSASAVLFNGGSEVFSYDPPRFDGYNFINNTYFYQSGSVGGFVSTDTLAVGHSATQVGPSELNAYIPWGPEYECQYLNPAVANPGTALGDYGTPFYLAGVDDQEAFSGSANPPRPIATDPVAGTFAEWLQLTRVPDAQQDGLGGVLYSATYTAPASPSDYYLDVIAYDKAAFPALTSPEITYAGQTKNWRIYDNVGGFTTTTFDGSNDILVVSDYALGQKFSATTFGGEDGNSNLQPTFYGAESYYTDVDEGLLPNASDYFASDPLPTPPPIPAQSNQAFPTQVSATAQVNSVIIEWAGNFQPTYNIYRTTVSPATFPADYTLVGTVTFANPTGTVATTFTDTGLTNGTTYYYVVTSVSGTGNESAPSRPPQPATPEAFGGVDHNVVKLFSDGDNSFNVLNGLGVGSYNDGNTDDGGSVSVLTIDPITGDPKNPINANLPNRATAAPYVRSQKYSLWRVLSRGPISSSVLAGYQPTFQSQPAVNDVTNKVTAAAETAVPVAQRCVIWVAPYSGNLPLVDSGSIENPSTQQTLQGFLAAGGRLCLTGPNVASALSLKGTSDPTVTGSGAAFLSNYLRATFLSQAGGGQILGGSGARITGNSGFNAPPDDFPRLNSDGTITLNVPPASDGALLLGNDFDGPSNWRTDSSLDQLGPNVDVSLNVHGGIRSAILALAQINTITPSATATTDMTTNGAPGLIYHEDYTDTLGSGYGSRVVFGSFGLEGISTDYYEPITSPAPVIVARNQRQKILHNIVSYLRTGTITVHVTQASGQGLAGATVYLQPNGGTLPGPRQLFSAGDPNGQNTAGNYVISGVEPGSYIVVAYKTGFTTTVSNLAFVVEGDTTNNVGLVLAPVPPGRIQGTVTDNAGNDVAGATITFTSTDGQITYTATSASDGTYKIDPAAVGTYNGTASKLPQYTTATAPTQKNPITVPSGGTGQADFVLQAKPASVSGTVFNDLNGDGTLDNGEPGVPGATVTFTPQNSAITTPTPVPTDANGLYTITGLAPGTYTITVTATGFLPSTVRTVTVAAGDALTGHDIPLIVAPTILPGTIGGLIADAFTGSPLGGATVTIVNTTTGVTVTTTSTTATSTPGAPTGDGAALNYGPVSLQPGTYNVTVTLAGFGAQTISNVSVVANTFSRVDFTSANGNPLEPVHVFASGYNFFSVPYDYSAAGITIDQVFGTLNTGSRAAPSAGSNRSHLFVWSPVLLQYVLDPTPPADGLHLGQGYWVYLNAQTEITRIGTLPTTVTIPVGLHQGWNMIGVPSLTPISAARLTFSSGTGTGSITFAQASSNAYHLVSPTMYGYSGGSYFTVSGTGTLQPWQSYWIYAFTETTILIPTGGG